MATAPARARPPFKEEQILRYVMEHAEEDNAQSVLAAMDDFGRTVERHMSVGAFKGDILRTEIVKRKPKVTVELGAYCGYSAVLIGAALPPDGHLYSVEVDALHAAISTKMAEHAGLRDKVTVLVGTLEQKLPVLKNLGHIDLLFVDHEKTVYLSDLKLLEEAGLVVKGTVIVADNVRYPGAPDYLQYVTTSADYSTVVHDAPVIASDGTPLTDLVTVSTRL